MTVESSKTNWFASSVARRLEFLTGDLPDRRGINIGTRSPEWDELTANPGVWAKWWGGNVNAAHGSARNCRREGFTFEARIVDGVSYVRAIRVEG
jgi:hypothetical protein